MNILDELTSRGLRVRVDGDQLRVSPPDLVGEKMAAFVRDNRDELVRLVRGSRVIERQGRMVLLEGAGGWMDEAQASRPCRQCGGVMFWVSRKGMGGLGCVKCVKRPPDAFTDIRLPARGTA